jgi:hypothetical protein
MKKLTGTTSASQGGSVSIAHGLTVSKILSVTILVEYFTDAFVPASYQYNTGYEFTFWMTASQINVVNVAGNSVNVLSKPFKILITYEQ